MKVLIVGDFFIKPSIVQSYLKRELGEGLKFRTIEWKFFREDKVSYKGERSRLGVREYAGSPEDLAREVKDVEILVVHGAPVTKEVIEAAERLKVIGCTRGGPVNVDVKAATERGIPVIYTPGRNAEAVADFTIGLMIAEARNIARAHASLKSGRWELAYNRYENLGPELHGKTLGIIGFGRIGRKVAVRARAFGMKILVYDPYVSKEKVEEVGGEKVTLEELLRNSDFVSLHCRLTEETRGIIGARELSMMKRTAYLINTARGGLIDKKALIEALKRRKIAGAALDVYETEPIEPDDELLSLENVTLTSHIAGYSREVVHRSASMVASDIRRYLNGEKPKHIFNPIVLER